MWGQSSRGFDRKNAYFRPIEDDDQMACSSSSPSAASSPVSFWSTASAATSTKSAGVSEDDLLTSLHEEARKDRERMKLINELILSEREYVQDLEAINSLFLQPLRKRRIVPENDVGQLFSTLPAIISLNKALLSAVVGSYTQAEAYNRSIDATVASLVQNRGSCTNSGGARGHGFSAVMTARGLISLTSVKRKECLIADAFQQMASYLKVYTTYSTRYVDAVAMIKRHRAANPAFGAFLEEVKGAPECRGRDMKTLMLRPVQRLCQYITILDDLVRRTPRTHGDYDLLTQTAAKVQETARSAEESLLTLQMAAKDADDDERTTTSPIGIISSNNNSTTPRRTGSRGSSGNRRRKVSLSEERPARIERRRDSLADMPDVTLEPTTATATSQQDASRQPKRQVSWRFSLGRVSALSGGHVQQRSFSVGDRAESGESLLSLLEREKQQGSSGASTAAPHAKGGSGGSTGSRRHRGLKRGGSLTNTGSIDKAQPRRVNSAVSLCRCESATGVTFKGGLVC